MPSDTNPTEKQRLLVKMLTSGGRTSLNRCWRAAYGSHHNPSLQQMLASPAIVGLFAEAIAAGAVLPHQFKDEILEAVASAEIMALR